MADTSPVQDIDLSFLNEIADGNKEFVDESIEMFVAQTPGMLDTIKAGILEKNWQIAAAAAHKLKPNLGFFGMTTSEELSRNIELMAKSNAPEAEQLILKFNELSDIVEKNLILLTRMRENKQIEL